MDNTMSRTEIRIETVNIPTYPFVEPEVMPLFSETANHQGTSGNPYPVRPTSNVIIENPSDKPWTVITLENKYIRISIMPELSIGAESHHERPDGKGYPQGLSGDEIPKVAQIIAVADTFDAMYSDRPYRKRMNFDKVVSIISEVAGTQLSEDVVEAFLRIVARGGFRAKNDTGGGSTEDIDNIHKRLDKEAKEAQDAKSEEGAKED